MKRTCQKKRLYIVMLQVFESLWEKDHLLEDHLLEDHL